MMRDNDFIKACDEGDLETIKKINDLNHFSDNIIRDGFVEAGKYNHVEVVKHLYPFIKDYPKGQGILIRALEGACQTGSLEVVKFFFEKTDNFEQITGSFLIYGAMSNQPETMSYLLEKYKDNLTRETLANLYGYAARNDSVEVMDYLLGLQLWDNYLLNNHHLHQVVLTSTVEYFNKKTVDYIINDEKYGLLEKSNHEEVLSKIPRNDPTTIEMLDYIENSLKQKRLNNILPNKQLIQKLKI